MQPLGAPVVPLVKAIRQTSSAEVSQAWKSSALVAASASSEAGPWSLKYTTCRRPAQWCSWSFCRQNSASSFRRTSHSAA